MWKVVLSSAYSGCMDRLGAKLYTLNLYYIHNNKYNINMHRMTSMTVMQADRSRSNR